MLFRSLCGFFDDGDFVAGQVVQFVNEVVKRIECQSESASATYSIFSINEYASAVFGGPSPEAAALNDFRASDNFQAHPNGA
jgi:hypothetical protein